MRARGREVGIVMVILADRNKKLLFSTSNLLMTRNKYVMVDD